MVQLLPDRVSVRTSEEKLLRLRLPRDYRERRRPTETGADLAPARCVRFRPSSEGMVGVKDVVALADPVEAVVPPPAL
jgi:hypothetical protein